jgi:hypothetical protein
LEGKLKMNQDQDKELGLALKRVLDPGDNRLFISRVLARIDTAPVAPLFWDLLGSWARRGIPAAIMLAALTAFLLALPRQPAANLEDTLAGGTDGGASLITSPGPPDAGPVLNTP